MNFTPILEKQPVHVSVPCRVDFGGTLDISTFYLPLAHLKPATFNLALDMRTHVRLLPWTPGRIKISSKGFDTIERDQREKGVDNPMGLMFAVAQYFNAHGVHIEIDSSSPPAARWGAPPRRQRLLLPHSIPPWVRSTVWTTSAGWPTTWSHRWPGSPAGSRTIRRRPMAG